MKQATADKIGYRRAGINSDEPDQDDHAAEQETQQHKFPKAMGANAGKYVGQLKAYEQKDESVEDKRERVPHGLSGESRASGQIKGAFVAKVQPARDCRQHPGRANALRGKIGEVGRDQADRDLDRCVNDFQLDQVNQLSQQHSDRDATEYKVEKPPDTLAERRRVPRDEQ